MSCSKASRKWLEENERNTPDRVEGHLLLMSCLKVARASVTPAHFQIPKSGGMGARGSCF